MLARDAVLSLIGSPRLISDPSFARGTFLGEFAQLMFGAIYRQNQMPIDPTRIKLGGSGNVISVLDVGRMLAVYAFDLGINGSVAAPVREEFVCRACGGDNTSGGLIHDTRMAGAAIVLVRTEQAVPGQYEICEKREIAWYLSTMRPVAKR